MKKLLQLIVFVLLFLVILFGILRTPDHDIQYLKEKYTFPESNFVEMEGMQVHYRETGTGDSVILLLHGTGSSLHTWEVWQKMLSENYKVVSLDLPGFGLTGPHPKCNYSMEMYVRVIDLLAVHLAIDTLIIAGNSLGGGIAWNYAVKYPDKIQSLVLLAPSGYPNHDQVKAFDIAQNPVVNKLVKYITPKSLVEDNLATAYYNKELVTDTLVSRYYDLLRRSGNRQAFIDRANTMTVLDTSSIKEIVVPVLIIWGEEDTWISPANGARFSRDLRSDTLVKFPKVGHIPMEEVPQKSAQVAINFLNSISI